MICRCVRMARNLLRLVEPAIRTLAGCIRSVGHRSGSIVRPKPERLPGHAPEEQAASDIGGGERAGSCRLGR